MPAQYSELRFPSAGVVRRAAYQHQPPFTTPYALNVRPDDASLERERGGSRPGLLKIFSQQLAGTVNLVSDVVWVNSFTGTAFPQAAPVNLQISSPCVVAGGQFYVDKLGTGTIGPVGPPVFATNRLLTAVDHLSMLYIAGDRVGGIWKYLPLYGVLMPHVASVGTVPPNCTIVTRYRDRQVLCGDLVFPNNVYMSAQGDPTNWDYTASGAGAAVELGTGNAGTVGEPIRAACVHSDQAMVFGGDSSLWMLRGDPLYGGQLSALSRTVGILDTNAWCYDTGGHLWFLSRDGLYFLPAGAASGTQPVSVSREKLPQELRSIDRSVYAVQLAYDNVHRGIHIFVTPYSTDNDPGTHWWVSLSTEAYRDAAISFWPVQSVKVASFFQVSLANNFEPLGLYQRRQYIPSSETQSLVWLGCRDGYIRAFDLNQQTDDGSNFSSYVDLGPFPLATNQEGRPEPGFVGLLLEIQATLTTASNAVTAAVRVGYDPEDAVNNYGDPFSTHAWGLTGSQHTARPRARGTAAVVRVSGTPGEAWGLESLAIRTTRAGRKRIA